MATTSQGLSNKQGKDLIEISRKKFGIVVATWNDAITEALYSGAYEALLHYGAKKENIIYKAVPGSFELSLGAQWLALRDEIDAVICLGTVVKGETPHFDYICQSVSQGIKDVGLKYNKPVIFGVLTTNNQQQAMDRAGGIHGNKGDEAAVSAIQMLSF